MVRWRVDAEDSRHLSVMFVATKPQCDAFAALTLTKWILCLNPTRL